MGSFKRLQLRCQPELPSSEGSTGTGDPASGRVGKLVLAIGGRPSILPTWASPQAASGQGGPWSRQSKREQGRRHNAFYDFAREVIHLHFCHSLFIRSESPSPASLQGEGYSASPFEGRGVKEFVVVFKNHHRV